MFSFRRITASVLLVLLVCSVSAGQQVGAGSPKNVIIMIPDGMGPSTVTLARLLTKEQALAIDPYLVGASITHAEDRIVTDSAASGTAIATGVRTYNGRIGMDPQGRIVASVLEAAKLQRQMAIGVVATSRITHATPGAFTGHVYRREQETTIAEQQQAFGIDLLYGGGRRSYLPEEMRGYRQDGRNLLEEARGRGTQIIETVEEFRAEQELPVLALLAHSELNFEVDRRQDVEPSLAEMTVKAIELLSEREEGFVLMVEGSKIDHAGHAHDAATMVKEIMAFDEAFAAAIDFARRDGNTLVVSVADHDTGGMTIVWGKWNTEEAGPLRLERVKASVWEMARQLKDEGRAAREILQELAGVDDATDEELAVFEKEEMTAKEVRSAFADVVNDRLALAWTTGDHSAVDVHVYAYGPGSERFRGAYPHGRIATTIADLLGLDLELASRQVAAIVPHPEPVED